MNKRPKINADDCVKSLPSHCLQDAALSDNGRILILIEPANGSVIAPI
jgi:hypothetical protein